MTSRQANFTILAIFGLFILYRTVFPAKPDDTVTSNLLGIAINIVSGIILVGLIEFLFQIKQLKFYFQTRALYRNTDIRLSIAYLFRIKIDNQYLLVKSRTRNYFQPVGGAFKTLPGSEKTFEQLGVKPDKLIETEIEKGIAKGDLRVYVRGRFVIEFLEWFKSKEDREISPWREFCEELISTGILPWQEFRYIDYKFKSTIQTPIIKLDSGGYGIFIYEVYDLVVNDEQKPILRKLLQDGNTKEYVWADEHLINRLGHDERTKEYAFEIAKHTRWAKNLKWDSY